MSEENNAELAWQNIETAEVEFLRNLADKGGLADPVPGMLRHCAKLIDCLARFKARATAPPDRYETEEEGDAFAHGYVAGLDDAKVAANNSFHARPLRGPHELSR